MILIQGVFFQNQEWLDLATKPVDGVVAVIKRGLIFMLYAGVIKLNSDPIPQLEGEMFDYYGISTLSDITVNETGLSFTKQYKNRPDTIRYTFTDREGITWAGRYAGEAVGSGISRCVITEVGDSFMDPVPLMALLKAGTAHIWNRPDKP